MEKRRTSTLFFLTSCFQESLCFVFHSRIRRGRVKILRQRSSLSIFSPTGSRKYQKSLQIPSSIHPFQETQINPPTSACKSATPKGNCKPSAFWKAIPNAVCSCVGWCFMPCTFSIPVTKGRRRDHTKGHPWLLGSSSIWCSCQGDLCLWSPSAELLWRLLLSDGDLSGWPGQATAHMQITWRDLLSKLWCSVWHLLWWVSWGWS